MPNLQNKSWMVSNEGSIAEAQGIVAGDQIICVDGLPLMTATHKEAVAFISIRNKVCLLELAVQVVSWHISAFIDAGRSGSK